MKAIFAIIAYCLLTASSIAKTVCYTSGTFDMFHVGHLNILRNAKSMCDTLIAGVHPDDIVEKRKNKRPIIPLEQRMEILRGIKYVDMVVQDDYYDFDVALYDKFKMDYLFIGDDYYGKFNDIEKKFSKLGVKLIYIPYTKQQSSTKIRASMK